MITSINTDSARRLPAYDKDGRLSCKARCRAFTLVEMMVTVTLLALVLGSMIPTFSFFTKSITRLGNYTLMSQDSRSALERFGRDLHAADGLLLAKVNELTLSLPTELGGGTVNYKHDAGKGSFIRTTTDSSGSVVERTLFEDVSIFKFVYYNRLGVDVSGSPSIFAETKSVQIDAKLLKTVITTETTDYIISARFLMRNYN